MQLILKNNLPFTTLKVTYSGKSIEVPHVLIDTGSASTVLAADILMQIGIVPEPQDYLHTIRGVGGTEAVFTRQIDQLQIGQRQITQFQIEVGGMDYGFEINGIVGMDFLLNTRAIINLKTQQIQFSD